MIFRLTLRASNKLRISCERVGQRPVSMLEWYGNLIIVQRRQYFLFTHARSLFSFWTPAAGCNRDNFGPMFRGWATAVLRDYGFSHADIAHIVDQGSDLFGPTADRVIVGSMVEFTRHLRFYIDYKGGLEHMSPRRINDIANNCLMSMIGMEEPVIYLRQILRLN